MNDLQSATKEYCSSNLLAEGGYGSVYKGYLRGSVVAIKRLTEVKQLIATEL